MVLLSSLLSPLIFAIWLAFETFLPRHKVARMFHSPCLKFLTNCGAYQIFLFVLTLTSFQRDTQFLEYSITGEYRRVLKVSILYFLFQLDFLEDLAYFLNVMIKQARNKEQELTMLSLYSVLNDGKNVSPYSACIILSLKFNTGSLKQFYPNFSLQIGLLWHSSSDTW